MLGILASEIVSMLSRTKIALTTNTVLIGNKEVELSNRGGVFLFGYRFYNQETNEIYNNTAALRGIFQTESHEWNYEEQKYDDSITVYYEDDCRSVYDDDITSNALGGYVKLDTSYL